MRYPESRKTAKIAMCLVWLDFLWKQRKELTEKKNGQLTSFVKRVM